MNTGMFIPKGMKIYQYVVGEMLRESRQFIWLPCCLPVVDQYNLWDGKTYKFIWLKFARLRGTSFGWETVLIVPIVDGPPQWWRNVWHKIKVFLFSKYWSRKKRGNVFSNNL